MKPNTNLTDFKSPPAKFLIYLVLALTFGKLYDMTLTAATDKRLTQGHINISPLAFESLVVMFAIAGIGCAVGFGFTVNQLIPWVRYQFSGVGKYKKVDIELLRGKINIEKDDGSSDTETE